MILTHKNEEGYIKSYFEWMIVNRAGKPDFSGEYMYVCDLWVHEDVDTQKEIMEYIGELSNHAKTVNIKYVYWKRHKTGKMRISKAFPKDLCVKRFIKFARRKKCYQ